MGGVSLVDIRAALSFLGQVRGCIPGAQFQGSAVRGDQVPAFRRVLPGKKDLEGNPDEVRIAVIRFPVREREFGRFDQEVDVFGGIVSQGGQVEPFQDGQLLQEDRSLRPGTAFEDVVPPVGGRYRVFDPGSVA